MKKTILISTMLSCVSWANNSSEPLQVHIESRTIQIEKSGVKNNMATRQMPAPNKHQTVLTKNTDGTVSSQCQQKHNHKLDKVVK